jgi:hypothetical protein
MLFYGNATCPYGPRYIWKKNNSVIIKHIDVTHMVLLCGAGYIADSPRCLGQRSKLPQLRLMHAKNMALVADVQTLRYPTCSPSNKDRKL